MFEWYLPMDPKDIPSVKPLPCNPDTVLPYSPKIRPPIAFLNAALEVWCNISDVTNGGDNEMMQYLLCHLHWISAYIDTISDSDLRDQNANVYWEMISAVDRWARLTETVARAHGRTQQFRWQNKLRLCTRCIGTGLLEYRVHGMTNLKALVSESIAYDAHIRTSPHLPYAGPEAGFHLAGMESPRSFAEGGRVTLNCLLVGGFLFCVLCIVYCVLCIV